MLASLRGPFRLDMLRGADTIPGLRDGADQILQAVGLANRASTPIGDLSYGEKRRLEIGLTVSRSPTVLLLDEPFAGLSAPERREVTKLLKMLREGRTIVLIEHDMEIVFELADVISVISEGQLLAQGSPQSIQSNLAVRTAYLGGVKAHGSAQSR
jgi:branched-chain amino acid transport system permease protein